MASDLFSVPAFSHTGLGMGGRGEKTCI